MESSSKESPDLAAVGAATTRLLALGIAALGKLMEKKRPLSLVCWIDELRTYPLLSDETRDQQRLEALWKYLVRDPLVAQLVRDSMEAEDGRFAAVLPTGSVLLVEIANRAIERWPTVTLEEALSMTRGKNARLQCCGVRARLAMSVESPGSAPEEATRLGIDAGAVDVSDADLVTVQVTSLNQAYTLASLRLEPSRRSHTGRIYDRLQWKAPTGFPVLLEVIRVSVEAGTWKRPARLDAQPENDDGGRQPSASSPSEVGRASRTP